MLMTHLTPRPRHPQYGFNLVELLLVSLLGGLILLAASQVYAALAQQQMRQQLLLQLDHQARLAELALTRDLAAASGVVAAGAASASYPSGTQHSRQVNTSNGSGQSVSFHFQSATDSDWLLVQQPDTETHRLLSLWHRDQKSQGWGLSHQPAAAGSTIPSQTMIPEVELFRVRLQHTSGQWQRPGQVNDWSSIRGIQFALLLKSSQPLPGHQSTPFTLWQETLQPPQDQHLRILLVRSVHLQEVQHAAP